MKYFFLPQNKGVLTIYFRRSKYAHIAVVIVKKKVASSYLIKGLYVVRDPFSFLLYKKYIIN
jgi:hypothetical protein